jgi:hypothetical protein
VRHLVAFCTPIKNKYLLEMNYDGYKKLCFNVYNVIKFYVVIILFYTLITSYFCTVKLYVFNL